MAPARLEEKSRFTSTIQLTDNRRKLTAEGSSAFAELKKSGLKTEMLVGGVEVIEKIFAEWTELCEEGASNDPFLRPEWFLSFVRNFEKEIRLLTVRRGEKLRAVLPLVLKNGTLHGVPVKKLQAVFNLHSQRYDLVHGADEEERNEIINAVWTAIKILSKWDVLEIRLVKKDSWLNDLLAAAETENHRTGIWQMDSAPYITLPQAEDKERLIAAYFKGLSKNRRQLLKKKRRYLEEWGSVEFVSTRGYSAALIQRYLALESSGWKGRAGTAVVEDRNAARLYDDFARAVAAQNALLIYELKLDGAAIAMYISIMFDRQTVGWKMSYDENYARFSPGNLLFIEVLNDCMRNGSPELDQLSPATYNKSMWATGEYEHAAFYVFQRGIIGAMLWKWKFSIIGRLRRFKK